MTRKAVETGALWKPWENGDIKQTTLGVEFFHRSHRFYDEIHPPKNETPRLQKCNLCARCSREKLLPMNRELQRGCLLSRVRKPWPEIRNPVGIDLAGFHGNAR